MAPVVRQPTNLSLLQPTKFTLSFLRMPTLVWNLQSVNIPGISANEVLRQTPFVDTYVPGDKAQYDTFNITFLVGEEMREWFEIHDWLRGYTFPENWSEYKALLDHNKVYGGQYSDAVLTITNNANIPAIRFKMVGVFPTMLGSLSLSQTGDANETVVGDATFRFSYYTVDRLLNS